MYTHNRTNAEFHNFPTASWCTKFCFHTALHMNCNENMCVHGLYLRQPKCQMCVYLHESKKNNSECGPILNHEK